MIGYYTKHWLVQQQRLREYNIEKNIYIPAHTGWPSSKKTVAQNLSFWRIFLWECQVFYDTVSDLFYPSLFFFTYVFITLWAQSFTSLKADLFQDIKKELFHLTGVLMEHFLEGITPLRHWYINPNEKSNIQFFSSELTYQSLNGALPSRKCSIKAPAKCKTPVLSWQRSTFNEVNDWVLYFYTGLEFWK